MELRPEFQPASRSGITPRALLIGFLLSAILGVATPYENLVISGSPMSFDYSTPAAIFLFFLFVLLVNPLLGGIGGRWGLTQAELATVYVMAMVACTLPTNGLAEMFLSTISGGTYYATPENQWAEHLLPYVKSWMVVTDQGAVKGFYEGAPSGTPIPWGAWTRPLLFWTPLLVAVYTMMIALMLLLRKQWISHERLQFPLIQVPIAMIGDPKMPGRGRILPFFKSPLMWLGALVPVILNSQWALHHYFPGTIPQAFPLWKYIYFWKGAFFIRLGISYAVVGFGYLLNTQVSFSIWFLGLFTTFEHALFTRIGLTSTRRVSYSAIGSAILAHQGFGALMALVVVIFYRARHHLLAIARQAWNGTKDEDDILSPRQVLGLIAISFAIMLVWLRLSGMNWWVAFLTIFFTFAIVLGVARIVGQGGLAVTRTPLLASDAIITIAGSRALGPANLVSMGMSWPWSGEFRTSVMAAFMHALKLAENYIKFNRGRLLLAVGISIATAISSSVITLLILCYSYGGINLSRWAFGSHAYDFMAKHIFSPHGISWDCWWATGAGALIQIALTVAHQYISWWPIHPVVFPVSAIWSTHHLMPSIFIAWMIKSAVLRYGGPRWYRKTLPFFLGMILGQYISGGMWIIIDGFTGMTGNYLFFW